MSDPPEYERLPWPVFLLTLVWSTIVAAELLYGLYFLAGERWAEALLMLMAIGATGMAGYVLANRHHRKIGLRPPTDAEIRRFFEEHSR